MKRSLLLYSLLVMVSAVGSVFAGNDTPANDKAQKWNVDRAHSAVTFTIRHFFTPVNGAFDKFSAEIYFDPTNLAGSSISATIEVTSVNTKNDNRDKHLQNPDFFEVEKWPTMNFESSSITKTGENTFVAKGKLTIKDKTTDFELPFTLLGTMANPRRNVKQLAAISSTFRLNRLDFGVGTGRYVETAVVGDEVDVSINLELLSAD